MKVNYQWHNAPKELPDCEFDNNKELDWMVLEVEEEQQ